MDLSSIYLFTINKKKTRSDASQRRTRNPVIHSGLELTNKSVSQIYNASRANYSPPQVPKVLFFCDAKYCFHDKFFATHNICFKLTFWQLIKSIDEHYNIC